LLDKGHIWQTGTMTEILKKWEQLGGENCFLGKPKSDEQACPDGIGRYQHFDNGSIHWHPSTGAYETHGAIGKAWAEHSWENGRLGYPISDERVISDSELRELVREGDVGEASKSYNRGSEFQGGRVYFWSPDNHRYFTTIIYNDANGMRFDHEHESNFKHSHHAIKCRNCGYSEDTTVDLIVKIIGGALPIGGFWAWVAYLFAGTGLAMPICIALVTGGVGILVFKEQIVQWIVNMGYKCPKCGKVDWAA